MTDTASPSSRWPIRSSASSPTLWPHPQEVARYRRHGLNVREAPKVTHFREESRRFERAIAMAGVAEPRFVVVCGDMVNSAGDPGQVAEVKRLAARLPRPACRSTMCPATTTPASTTRCPTPRAWRVTAPTSGPDFYAFREGDAHFVVLNACLLQHPERVPEDFDRQMSGSRTR